MNRVLVVGGSDDPHIARVITHLGKKAASVVLDPRSRNAVFSLQVDPRQIQCALGSESRLCRLDAFTSVWWRLKPTFGFTSETDLIPGELEFRESEWSAVYKSLPQLTPQAHWVNARRATLEIAQKPHQLVLAKSIGLNIPRTIFSNSEDHVEKFLSDDGDFIYKTLSNFVFPGGKYIYTTPMSKDEFAQNASILRSAPGIFQERVQKRFEWRVTIVGGAIFPVRIHSQDAEKTLVDWRRDQIGTKYERGSIPDEVCDQLMAFQEAAGLIYGAYDLVETPDGEFVFLECNPSGQWLWLEDATGLPISEHVAASLLNTNRR